MLQSPRWLRSSWQARAGLLASVLLLFSDRAYALSPDIVISQVYGGGGNAGATWRNDFIELFNRGPNPVNITGWSVQYAAASGTSWQKTDLSGTVPAGGYYLVQEAAGANMSATALPTPDASGGIAMSGSAGKVALVNNNTLLTSGTSCPVGSGNVVDFVGFGAANCSETSPTGVLTNPTAALRLNSGCTETDNNSSDFLVDAANPRNSAAPAGNCGEVAPSVSSTSPANGATNVPVASSIVVSFNEPVNVLAGAISVECPIGSVVASNGALNGVTSANLVPTSSLPAGVSCQISVTASGVSDVDLSDPPDTLSANFTASFSTQAGATCGAADTPIGAIQGTGTSANLIGTQQTVQGVVVADYEFPGTGTSTDYLRGFYLQNPAANSDGNPATSDAIFVFNANASTVSVGQLVQVTGTVGEFGFSSTGGTQTQLTSPSIEICSGSAAVSPVSVTMPFSSVTDIERYEGMLVQFPQTLFVTEHFQLGRFAQVMLSSGARLPQPTETAAPGAPALAVMVSNSLNNIFIDDDLQTQNPDPIRFGRGAQPLSASNTLRGGDTLTGLSGVLTQTDATSASNVPATSDPVRYRVRPFNVVNPVTPNFQAVNPRPTGTATVAGALKLAGFNLLNYFNTLGGPGQLFSQRWRRRYTNGVSGAENTAEFDRQWPKTVAALQSIDADVFVFNELENNGYGPTSALQDLVGKLNNAVGAGTYSFVNVDAQTGQTNALGNDAIRVAMIYKPAKVTPVGTAVANTGAFGIYNTTGTPAQIQRNRPALAQAFATPGGGRIVVVGNHLKSKSPSETSPCSGNISPVGSDPDTGDGQGECNLTRKAAAEQLVSWLATDPTRSGRTYVLLLGDYNAYAKEDPIAALEAGGYVDLAPSILGASAYSYVFDGQWGSLDHALASPALRPKVTGLLEWHINADEPSVLDYNTDFKSTSQLSSLYAPDRYRVSDHDVIVVGVTLPDTAPSPVPTFDTVHTAILGLLLLATALLVTRLRKRTTLG